MLMICTGTLRRSATIELYMKETDELYRRAGMGTTENPMELNIELVLMWLKWKLVKRGYIKTALVGRKLSF